MDLLREVFFLTPTESAMNPSRVVRRDDGFLALLALVKPEDLVWALAEGLPEWHTFARYGHRLVARRAPDDERGLIGLLVRFVEGVQHDLRLLPALVLRLLEVVRFDLLLH